VDKEYNMKPYNQLTRLGQLRRLRQLAEAALTEYGLSDANLKFQHYEGNVIFRVDVPGETTAKDDDIYVPNRYNLRILSMNDPEATEGELIWLAALRNEAGLPVPEPVPTLDGKLLTTLTTPGVPHGRVVSLMRWVDGQQLSEKSLRPSHVKAWGQLVGRLHKFASTWKPPKGFTRFHWNWDGILGNGVLQEPVDELIASMPGKYREPFETVSAETKAAMAILGTGPEVYGMVHIDMYLENILFKAGKPRIIDFEDCGFGYYLYDLAITLSQWLWNNEMSWFREVFLDGYTETHTLPNEYIKYLDLFIATRFADFTLWGTAFIVHDPARAKEHTAWRDESGDKLLRYFEER
jgi:Ser/Thr protein kinase RdoA (MazF antagonist)